MPKPNLSYKILKEYLEENKIKALSPKDISEAVTTIRKSKLPDPNKIGNAGSFFKNVFVDKNKLKKLQKVYPDMPYFEEETTLPLAIQYKIPAGWLIEQCGFKGRTFGNVGVHNKQALVLVNYGGATGSEILNLANKIIISVRKKFGLELTPEVNLI